MNRFDSLLYSHVFNEIDELLGENLVLKKKLTGDNEYSFVVTSDNPDVTKGNNETFVKRELIKNSGLFYFDKGNTRKWVSKDKFTADDFKRETRKFQEVVDGINGLERIIDAAEELEEYGEVGFSDRITKFIDELQNKVTAQAQTGEVKEFLAFREKFRKYSFYNTILVYIQKKDATLLKGAKQWEKDLGRKIKAGEKGIYIYVPVQVKEKDENGRVVTTSSKTQPDTVQDLRTTRFILRPIFDISQTEEIPGKAVAIPSEPKWFSDDDIDEKTTVIYDALLDMAAKKNIKVTVGDVSVEGAKGTSGGGKISLLSKNISVMVHELAHEMLHWKEDRSSFSRQVKELQAAIEKYLADKPKSNNKAPDRN